MSSAAPGSPGRNSPCPAVQIYRPVNRPVIRVHRLMGRRQSHLLRFVRKRLPPLSRMPSRRIRSPHKTAAIIRTRKGFPRYGQIPEILLLYPLFLPEPRILCRQF